MKKEANMLMEFVCMVLVLNFINWYFASSTGIESAILPLWFQLFNKELIRNISFSEHEAFDHPVACKFLFDILSIMHFDSITFHEDVHNNMRK